jgi:hypothetical protein
MRRLPPAFATLLVVVSTSLLGASPAAAAPAPEIVTGPPRVLVTDVALAPTGTWLVGSDGGVFAYDGAPFLGSASGARPGVRAVDIVPSPTGAGYAVVFADGAVERFGGFNAPGDATPFREPIVAGATTPSGAGMWLFGSRGGVFAFGDAGFHGSGSGLRFSGAVVDAMATPTGRGYRLVDAGGGVYAFGDASFEGSLPGLGVRARIVAATSSPGGSGYLLLGSDGGVFAFGDAIFPGAAHRPDVAGIAAAGGRVVVAASTDPPRGVDGPPVPDRSGTGRRVVYSNSSQRVWLVEQDGTVVMNVAVSGRQGVPAPGTYRVYSQSTRTWAVRNANITMEYMTRFARSPRSGVAIGFHGIPLQNGVPMQTFEQLGTYQSAGCVRMATADARRLYQWAGTGTTVVVMP